MESVIYGTGNTHCCARTGRLITMYVVQYCGTHMNLVNSLLLAGMLLSSTGIKVVILVKKGRSRIFCLFVIMTVSHNL
jgi:hypothetical protein